MPSCSHMARSRPPPISALRSLTVVRRAAVIEGDVRSLSGLCIEPNVDAAPASEAPDPGDELAPVHGRIRRHTCPQVNDGATVCRGETLGSQDCMTGSTRPRWPAARAAALRSRRLGGPPWPLLRLGPGRRGAPGRFSRSQMLGRDKAVTGRMAAPTRLRVNRAQQPVKLTVVEVTQRTGQPSCGRSSMKGTGEHGMCGDRPDRGMAEGRGFEPRTPFGEHAFQACALNHSAIPPRRRNNSNNT